MLSIRRTLAAAIALASWSCGSTQPDATQSVAAIVVNPPSSTLALNAQLPLQALVQDGSGNLVPAASVTWTVENSSIASVSPAGVVTALAIGTTQVAANAMGKSGIATITVQKTPVASVVVRPNRVDAAIGSTTVLTAAALDAAQNTLTDRAMIWTTSNAAVATVNAAGVVTAKAAGSATITATSEGKSDASVFTVAPGSASVVEVTPSAVTMVSGQTQSLAAAVKDASGTVLTGKTFTWASSNTAVATVASNGTVTAVAAGNAAITATADGVSGSATVTVTAAPVASVTVSPSAPTLVVGAQTQLTPTVTDVNGKQVPSPVVTWISSNLLVATVSASGVVTGLLPGTATITATSDSKSGTAAVTVTLAAVGSVTVAPPTLALAVGQTGPLTATVKDASGNVVTNRPVTWTSSAPAVATVDPSTGVVTGVTAGQAVVTATSGSASGTSDVTVTAVPVATVTVAPPTLLMNVSDVRQLVATLKDASGNVLTNRPVSWSSNALAVATVDATTGIVTGVGAGQAVVTATSGSASGTSALTVTQVPVASVTISPSSSTINQNATTKYTATTKDAAGNVLTGRVIAWQTNNANVANLASTSGASIDVVGGVTGSATITATSEGISKTSNLNVNSASVDSVSISLASTTIKKGMTTMATAIAWRNDLPLQNRTINWSANGAANISPSNSVTSTGPNSAATATVTGKNVSFTSFSTIRADIGGKNDSIILIVAP